MKSLTTLILLLNSLLLFSQSKIWYFGNQGGINFNNTPPTTLSNSLLNTQEGCAVATDSMGNLLFYTDGQDIYRPDYINLSNPHVIMSNGSGLMGSTSSTQSSIIVPWPGQDCMKFFVFTADAAESYYNSTGKGIRYSVVEITGGSYATYSAIVTTKNKTLLHHGTSTLPTNQQIYTTEKLASVGDNNGGYWMLTHGLEPNINATIVSSPNSAGRRFYAFHITTSGIDTNAVISTVGEKLHQYSNVLWYEPYANMQGELKFSSDGTLLATTTTVANFVEVFRFDRNTGIVTKSLAIKELTSNESWSYGIEFSPNNKYLFFSQARTVTTNNYSSIRRYNLSLIDTTQTALQNGNTLWNNVTNIVSVQYSNIGSYDFASLKIAPPPNTSQEIYVARNGKSYLAKITNTNAVSPTFVGQAINLSGGVVSYSGLPATTVAIGTNCNSTPLPIELISFEGYTAYNTNLLKWETVLSNVSSNFAIQRSNNNEDFETIGFVLGTNSQSNYNYSDIGLENGEYFYKLKVIDVDGQYNYSNTIVLKVDSKIKNCFYPNPSKEDIIFNDVMETISIIGVDGRLIASYSNQSVVNIENLYEGVYFIKMLQNGNSTIQRLIKIK